MCRKNRRAVRVDDRPTGVELLHAAGVPAWAVDLIVEKLQVSTDEDVEKAARDGSMKHALGGKANMASHVLRFIELGRWRSGDARPQESAAPVPVLEGVPLVYAAWVAQRLLARIMGIPGVTASSATGALRRGCEIVPSVDLILCADDPERTARRILAESRTGALVPRTSADPEPGRVLPLHDSPARPNLARTSQPRHSSRPSLVTLVTLRVGGAKSRIYVTDSASFSGLLQSTTGSPEHNRQLEAVARERGLLMDSGALVHLGSGKTVPVRDETQLYCELGLPFIPPEFREGADEIDAARRGKLSAVLQPGDVRGDVHVHTDWSDGLDSVDAVAEQALRRGYEYVAICDHTAHHSSANGLSPERLLREWAAIEEARRRFPSLTIMKGVEVDILPDGSLDLCDDLLQAADIVLASVHDNASRGPEELTRRLVRAMENPNVDILAHPTGRKIGWSGYGVDVDAVLDAARKNGVALEINCAPDRFDIDERLASRCDAAGIMTAIGSDSHSTGEMSLLDFGVTVARRGRNAKTTVLNTMTAEELSTWLSVRGTRGGRGGARGLV